MPVLSIAAAMLLLTPPGTPAGGFHWQRIITPPPGAPTEQACVVLDAATFANAAPALRDLRLFQDGTELPYVIEESYDERALNSGVTSSDDRSEYEPVLVLPLQMRKQSGAFDGWRGPGPMPTPPNVFSGFAHGELLAHIPVERVRLDPPATSPMQEIDVQAAPLPARPVALQDSQGWELLTGAERIHIAPQQSAGGLPVTLGANLQRPATVLVQVTGLLSHTGTLIERAVFEMRKRSLCYQPRSASPLVLYLGGGQGIAAKTYGLANGFSVSANRPYATMGPLEPNPDLDHPARHPISRLLIAIAVLGFTLLLTLWTGLEFLRKEKSRSKAAHS